jgi:hypothetical protein
MRNFYTWIDETNRKEQLEQILAKPTTNEDSTKRAGVRSHAYPPLYSRGQYPDLALTPTAADAAYYLSKGK